MKHAGPESLRKLEALLNRIRRLPGLTERKTGVFYRRSKAFAHFHEDPAGLFADVRPAGAWERFPVGSEREKRTFVSKLKETLDSTTRSGASF